MKYVPLILIGLLFSCNRNTEPSNTTRPDVTQIDTIACAPEYDTPLDSIIEKIDYVKLRSTENNPIGEVDALWITPDNIVVADYNLSKSIFIFDRLGRLQATISRLGRGPQEYLSIFDVVLTPDRQRVAVLDNHGKKILYYDLAGNFLFCKELPFYAIGMKYFDEENILMTTYGLGADDPGLASYPNNNDLLYWVDTTMRIRKSFMPNPFNKNFSCKIPLVKQFGPSRIYATLAYSDTVYRITPQGMIARYWIDLSPVGGVSNLGKEATDEKTSELIRTTIPIFMGELLESDRFIIFKPLDTPAILFSKKTSKCYYLNNGSSRVLNYHLASVDFAHEDRFITVVPAYQLCNVIKFKDSTNIELAEEIATGLTENDDPVLLFYTLKEPEADRQHK